jgi:hypothetical protein
MTNWSNERTFCILVVLFVLFVVFHWLCFLQWINAASQKSTIVLLVNEATLSLAAQSRLLEKYSTHLSIENICYTLPEGLQGSLHLHISQSSFF